MCEFFSCVVTRGGDVLFTEQNSHEEIIRRAGLQDTSLRNRSWVRVEIHPTHDGGWSPLQVDEQDTLPTWWTEDTAAREDQVLATAAQVRSAREAYYAAVQSAQKAYDAAARPAWEAYDAIMQQIFGYVARR